MPPFRTVLATASYFKKKSVSTLNELSGLKLSIRDIEEDMVHVVSLISVLPSNGPDSRAACRSLTGSDRGG